MRSALLLLQLSLWVSLSHAFFPWFPRYRCREDDLCTPPRKREQIDGDARPTAETGPISRRTGARAFPIRQRIPITPVSAVP